jgi:hypothetical protein
MTIARALACIFDLVHHRLHPVFTRLATVCDDDNYVLALGGGIVTLLLCIRHVL